MRSKQNSVGHMKDSGFLSLSYEVPGRIVSSEELEDKLRLGRGVIERLTGIRYRRYFAAGESPQELAVNACLDALARSGLEPSEVEGLVYYSDSPPVLPNADGFQRVYYDISAHLHLLLRERGILLDCECMAIGGSCVSFLHTLQMAAGLIKSGQKRSVLIVGAACNSFFLDNTDKNVAMTFGDGAAASLLGESPEEGLIGVYCRTDGQGYAAGFYPGYQSLFIDRKKVAEFAPLAFQAAMNGLLAKTGLKLKDFDVVIPHQAGIKIIERGMALCGIPPDKVYLCLQDYGNTGAPAVQLALAKAVEVGRVREGDLVALVAFGTGWNYGAAAFRYRDHSKGRGWTKSVIAPGGKGPDSGRAGNS